MTPIPILIKIIERAAEEQGIKPDTICRQATGNPRLFRRLKRRSEMMERDAQRILAFIASLSTAPPDASDDPSCDTTHGDGAVSARGDAA